MGKDKKPTTELVTVEEHERRKALREKLANLAKKAVEDQAAIIDWDQDPKDARKEG
jgi:hypothetical protein